MKKKQKTRHDHTLKFRKQISPIWNNLKQTPISSSLPLPSSIITTRYLPYRKFQHVSRPFEEIHTRPINSTSCAIAHPKNLITDRVFYRRLPIICRPFLMHRPSQDWQRLICAIRTPPVLECARYDLELRTVALLRIYSWSWLSGPCAIHLSCRKQCVETLHLLVVPRRYCTGIDWFGVWRHERRFRDLCRFNSELVFSRFERACMRGWRSPAGVIDLLGNRLWKYRPSRCDLRRNIPHPSLLSLCWRR